MKRISRCRSAHALGTLFLLSTSSWLIGCWTPYGKKEGDSAQTNSVTGRVRILLQQVVDQRAGWHRSGPAEEDPIEAMKKMDSRSVTDVLIAEFQTAGSDVGRLSTISFLLTEHYAEERLVPRLLPFLDHQNPEVRIYACWTAGGLILQRKNDTGSATFDKLRNRVLDAMTMRLQTEEDDRVKSVLEDYMTLLGRTVPTQVRM